MGQFSSIRIHAGASLIYRPTTLITLENKIQEMVPRDVTLGSGTGSLKCDVMYYNSFTLGASATQQVDLLGSLTDAFNLAISFVKVKFLRVEADSANNAANDVLVKPHSANGWLTGPLRTATHQVQLAAGENFQWEGLTSGRAPVAGTGDILALVNSAGTNSIVARLLLLGTSA
ncbi:MAG: hypothetical protein C4583_03100 [Anaerolineaceae bacterium]|nr:MAG: hypothetical protein C4583_03100 [Anaerolineaceae bacterium]